MLPLHIFFFVPLASATRFHLLHPRQDANTTSRPATQTGRRAHQESTVTDLNHEHFTPAVPVIQQSVTGWEVAESTTQQLRYVITTETPSLIFVRTEIEASITRLDPDNEPVQETTDGVYRPKTRQSAGDNAQPSEGAPPSPQQTGGDSTQAPADVPPSPQPSSNNLLEEIFTRLPNVQPQPTQPSNPPSPNGPQSTQPPNSPPPPALTIPNALTLGTATLTLTPGLSTTIGPPANPTFIQLSTDTHGQTIIVLSSSGTAISATVSNVPATMTLPKSGFDASSTAVARPGELPSAGGDGAAASSTASKGGAAVPWETGVGWWTGLAGALVGGVMIL
ncbi:hypothetical protein EJ04DRAFT_547884 [Polyplosphaeria fusca]|uniref:Uncharacterized protein n=1 Tax=Polyplosphaeria fusca TaxID=682080 RepID=A0A9P4RD95_9PLEO|nr:hypothetical protein EJ04DRAFT_547884 [Polyplosphaeria fusca]